MCKLITTSVLPLAVIALVAFSMPAQSQMNRPGVVDPPFQPSTGPGTEPLGGGLPTGTNPFLRDSPQNLGDVPGNGAAALPNCSKVSFLGPTIIAYCTSSSNLIIKSEIDVRACVGYLVAEDNPSGNLVCRQPVNR
jgi:hypothetical protein